MSMQKKMRKELVKIRKTKAEIMSEKVEMRQRGESCDSKISWNATSGCDECERNETSNDKNRERQKIVNEREVERRVNEMREVITRRRQRCNEIKFKGGVNKNKDKGVTRLFSVNCDGFGPESSDNIDQVIKESEDRDIYGIMISSSDTRYGTLIPKSC